MTKHHFLLITICFLSTTAMAQYDYEPSKAYPFGRLNPEAPKEVADFDPLIGECSCLSVTRDQEGNWGDSIPMTWRFKYILNGFGVQDETLKADGKHSGSIRQYIPTEKKWFVHYYSNNGPTQVLPAWSGEKVASGKIVLYRPQKAPIGTEGFYRITFDNISKEGFDWFGEWVDETEKIVYPTWKITCSKKKT